MPATADPTPTDLLLVFGDAILDSDPGARDDG